MTVDTFSLHCAIQYMPAHGLLHMASAHDCFLHVHDSCKKQHSHEHEWAESTEL